MITIKTTCDKCKKILNSSTVDTTAYHVQLGEDYPLDFCPNCYGELLRTVGTWIKG